MISVIIPAYNSEAYIDRCIESVLGQTFTDFEIIAVNDGSFDSTLSKLHNLAERDSRIRVIDQPNRGVVCAREAAVEVAFGEYLTFLDADDYLSPNALSSMLEPMVQELADLCVAAYTLVWEESGHHKFVCNSASFSGVSDCLKYCLRHGEMFLPIKLYRTDLYRKSVNIPHDVILQEDTIGLTQYLEHAKSAVYVNTSVYYYYKHSGTATSEITQRHIHSLLTVAEFLGSCTFFKEIPRSINLYRLACLGRILRAKDISETDQKRARDMITCIPTPIRLHYHIKQSIRNITTGMKRIIYNTLRK